MVAAVYKQVFGESEVNCGDADNAWGTMSPMFHSPAWASIAHLAPETWLHPGDAGQALGHGTSCWLGACKGWHVPWHPGDVALGMAACPLHWFSSCGAQMSPFGFFSFFVVCLLLWASPADQLDLTR